MEYSFDSIVQMMGDAARWHGIEPSKLSAVQLRKYMKESGKDTVPPEVLSLYGGFRSIRDAAFPPVPDLVAVKKEEVLAAARVARKAAKEAAKEGLFVQRIEEVVASHFADKITPSPLAKKKNSLSPRRVLNVVLSDLHFGSSLDPTESGVSYQRIEEARRLGYVAKSVISYKEDYRDQTALNVFLLGDIIENNLHDPRAGDELAKQFCNAVFLLSQFVSVVSQHFKRVTVYCSPGNHGRHTYRTTGRQISQKWDSYETSIYYSLKMAAAQLKNVEFVIPKLPYIAYEAFGMRGFATHGDTFFNPGNPGKTIEVNRIENFVNRLNASLPDAQEYRAIICGHVHSATVAFLSNGATLLTNGALTPAGDYAQSIGIPESMSYQLLWETVPGHMVGDFRIITLNSSVDKDRSLDDYIKPFDFF